MRTTTMVGVALLVLTGACEGDPIAPVDAMQSGAAPAEFAVTNNADTTGVPASPGNPTINKGTFQNTFSGLAFSCGGEPIAMTMTITYRWHTIRHASGDWMTTQHTTYAGTGSGLWTGVKFSLRGQANGTQVYAMPGGGAFTYTTVFRMSYIVQGSADNSYMRGHAKWTINGEGRVVLNSWRSESECRG